MLEVENFGPVSKGVLKISPFTIFIGKNNTGKSYVAMLYYSLIRSLSLTLGRLTREYLHLTKYLHLLKHVDSLREEVRELFSERVTILKRRILREFSRIERLLDKIVRTELERCFSCRLSELVRYGENRCKFNLCLQRRHRSLCLSTNISKEGEVSIRLSHDVDNIMEILELIRSLDDRKIHYLPASRSGILQAYKVIAQAIIHLAPLAPIRGLEIPRVSGVVADFLGKLVMLSRSKIAKNEKALELTDYLEKKILEGKLELAKASEIEIPDVMYFPDVNYGVPMTRVSSMISELSLLDLFIKYGVVNERDIVIIEEPEAHLHPEIQTELARILARLVNEQKLQLLITTHSEILLSKLSTLVSLSTLPDDELHKRGYVRNETLDPHKVSVYLFRKLDKDVVIEQVNVTEEGIPDDAFRKVIEELYEETMDIHYTIQKLRRNG